MDNSIICPSCKKPIPLTEALSHQLKEKLEAEREEMKLSMNEAAKKWKEEQIKKLEEEKLKSVKEVEEQMRNKVRQEMELKLKDTQNETEELKKQNQNLQEQLLELNKLMRQLKTENDQKRLEMEKKLAEEQEKIREQEQKRLDEQYRLKMSEKEKQLQDALKMNNELKIKLEQGSQQTQGEVLELEMEHMLQREFPFDEIKPVPKGVTGADIVQIVKNNQGKVCGTILWETKRTKAWSNEWITKLKDDQRQMKAELAVIISQILPAEIKHFGCHENIWVGNYELIIGIAYALRTQLLEVTSVKSASVGKNEKMEILYSYLTGVEFKQRVEGIIEAFTTLQDDIEKEKRWFANKWAKQEKSLRRVIDQTLGMHGDLHGIMGRELGEIDGLEILPEKTDGQAKVLDSTQTLF